MHKSNWNDLKFVFAVAEHGSLSGAARALGVNHATVLRRVTAFESAKGVELFERHANGYRMKPESSHVFARLHSIAKSVEGFDRSVSGLGGDVSGTVRVTSTDTLSQLVLMRYLRDLRSENPALDIVLSSTNARLDLARMDAEITVRPAKSLPPDLEGIRTCNLVFKVYGTPAYLRQHTSADPSGHTWLGVSELLMRSPVGQWQQTILGDTPVFRADSFLTLCAAAEAGMGLTMLPVFVGDSSDLLERAPQFPVSLKTDIWVAAHADLVELDRIRYLMTYLANALRADAPLLEGRNA